jgi:D-3-phosphoglycerate dehydrogenase
MSDVLVVESHTHPVRTETFAAAAGDLAVDVLTLERGSVGADVEPEIVDALDEHAALYFRTGRITRRLLDAHPPLSFVVTHGSGTDHIDVEAATDHGVAVVHTPEGPGPAVVEHTLGLMIATLRELPSRIDATARGEWSSAQGTVPELGELTVGVVGLGTIGLGVARALRPLGPDVLGADPYVTGHRESPLYPRYDRETVEDAGVTLVTLSALFDRADLVSVHVPLTAHTREMIGAPEFSTLDDGFFVNVARGDVVDEAALVDAADQLGGVALDVLSTEPPDYDDPLLSHPNVLVTPHVAASTGGYLERSATSAGEKLRTLFDGGRVDTVVNPAALGNG